MLIRKCTHTYFSYHACLIVCLLLFRATLELELNRGVNCKWQLVVSRVLNCSRCYLALCLHLVILLDELLLVGKDIAFPLGHLLFLTNPYFFCHLRDEPEVVRY